ncbi:HAD family hydrolase [Planococcus maritimus]|uniref:HAD family hydrolase n=1 Tax=Planococcus maritimus TaxID=192421 RepID=UPI000795FF08|nr:HAD-IA family hydrolase [Planococcus maritimus]KYG59258.1 L-2-haloalkanoic acid dehalogenase [Planococcus maritimus]
MIKAVLFDLDGTLLNRDATVASFIAEQYERLRPSLGHIPKVLYRERFIELDQRGYVWKDKVYRQLIQEFEIEQVTMESLLEDYLDHFRFYCVPFEGLETLLESLKAQGLKLGIISNGKHPFQMGNIDALGIAHHMDAILISESENLRKPDPEIFCRALGRLGVDAAESIFVGDHPVNDIDAAQAIGMFGVWKPSSTLDEAPLANAQIVKLDELNRIIETLNA